MKKLVLMLVFLFVLSGSIVFAEVDFSNFDKDYCTPIDTKEYCVQFVQSPFGPGYRGKIYIIIRDLDAVFSPVEEKEIFWADIHSQDGIIIKFRNVDWYGIFDDNQLKLFQDMIILE